MIPKNDLEECYLCILEAAYTSGPAFLATVTAADGVSIEQRISELNALLGNSKPPVGIHWIYERFESKVKRAWELWDSVGIEFKAVARDNPCFTWQALYWCVRIVNLADGVFSNAERLGWGVAELHGQLLDCFRGFEAQAPNLHGANNEYAAAQMARQRQQPEDDAAFVPVSTANKDGLFNSLAAATKFLDEHGQKPIRWRQKRTNRRVVHAGDWHRYKTEKERLAFEAIDNENLQSQIQEIEQRKKNERERKKGGK